LILLPSRRQENIIPIKLEGKEQYYLDLMNIEHSWTGRIDVFWSNNFFKRGSSARNQCHNAIRKKANFDCAFYSLRTILRTFYHCNIFVLMTVKTIATRNTEVERIKDRFPMNNADDY